MKEVIKAQTQIIKELEKSLKVTQERLKDTTKCLYSSRETEQIWRQNYLEMLEQVRILNKAVERKSRYVKNLRTKLDTQNIDKSRDIKSECAHVYPMYTGPQAGTKYCIHCNAVWPSGV